MEVNKLYKYAKVMTFCAVVWMFGFACTDSFVEYNTNKHEATEEMMSWDNLKTGSFFSQMQRNVVIFKDGVNASSDYQIGQGLSGDIYSGYIAPTGTWESGRHNGSYYFLTNWIQVIFNSSFAYVMPAWQSISETAAKQSLPELSALATVVKVEAMHRVADTYGPIPYVNFGKGTVQNDYDALEDVYSKFFEELDGAIEELSSFVDGNPGATLLEDFDYVYSGDVKKWVKFANTLRLRLALRVAYANPGLAKTEAEKSIRNKYGIITAANERASLKHSSDLVYYHPLYEIQNFNDGEARMSASMDAYMNGYSDPRLPVYFKSATSDDKYHGVRLGIVTTTWSNYVGDKISKLNMNESRTEIVWMTAAESYFLRAEGALRGWEMGGTAKDLYESGIKASFEENGVASEAASYIANTTATPSAFEDNVGSDNYTVSSTITIAWEDEAVFERNLERIITQKWIAMYPDGPEGWAEFRRTGYPRLIPVVTNNSSNAINSNIQVCRLPYPQSEYINNASGVQSGISKLGGRDNGGTKLWWDKKD